MKIIKRIFSPSDKIEKKKKRYLYENNYEIKETCLCELLLKLLLSSFFCILILQFICYYILFCIFYSIFITSNDTLKSSVVNLKQCHEWETNYQYQ